MSTNENEAVFDILTVREKLEYLFTVFERQYKELYVVGGAVRDLLLGTEPSDWDLTTDALPEEVEQWFDRTVQIGKRYGTVTVLLGSNEFQITTYRTDNQYTDGRRPDSVSFGATVEEDILRRDFTVNALYMDRYGSVFDRVGGLADLQNGVIRTVGDPVKRFAEDRLRTWRCVRFAAEKAFELDSKTRMSLDFDPDTSQVAPERLQVELNKLLLAPKVNWGGYLLVRTGLYPSLLNRILPGVQIPPEETLVDTFARCLYLPEKLNVRLLSLTTWMTREQRIRFLSAMRYPGKTGAQVTAMGDCLEITVDSGSIPFKSAAAKLGIEGIDLLTSLQEELAGEREDPEMLSAAQRGRFRIREIYAANEPLLMSELNMSGSIVKKFGYAYEEIGEVLRYLLYCVYEKPSLNTREALTALLADMADKRNKDEQDTGRAGDPPVYQWADASETEADVTDGDRSDPAGE